MATACGVRRFGAALVVIFGFCKLPRQEMRRPWLPTFGAIVSGLPKRFQATALQRLRRFGLLLSLSLSLTPVFYGHTLPHNQPVSFVDIAQSAGIAFKHENGASAEKFMIETFGSGVAWLDYDNDGLLDLFFANGADLHRDELPR